MPADLQRARESARIRSARRRREHPELLAAYQREYRKRFPEKSRAKGKRWRAAHPEQMHEICKKWETAHQKARSDYHRGMRHQLKLLTINEYGGKCCLCGESDHHKLSLDHSFQDGGAFRKVFRSQGKTMSGVHFYAWLKKQAFPKNLGLRVLCLRCNQVEYQKSRKSA